MKRSARKILLIVFAAVFAVSAGMLIWELAQYRQGEKTYHDAEKLAKIPDFSVPKNYGSAAASAAPSPAKTAADPYAEQLNKMDFAALSKVNSDVFGWILIPGTVISYPLLNGSDNRYYLRHTWKKQSSIVGSIFLEQSNRVGLTDFNTILYGHNMNNGSMFGSLKKYRAKSYWKAHPYVYITTASGSRRYQIFAAYEVSTQAVTYQVEFSSAASRQSFLEDCLKQAVYSTGVTPKTYDHILTLSTCTGHGHTTRWVVQARLPGTAPAEQTAQKTQSGTTAPKKDVNETAPDMPASADSSASSSATSSSDAFSSENGSETQTDTAEN